MYATKKKKEYYKRFALSIRYSNIIFKHYFDR